MLSAKTLLSIFFGFVILAGAVSVLAEEVTITTPEGEDVTLTLVPEDIIVNFAMNSLPSFGYNSGKNITEKYLVIPIYGLEDQVLSYYVMLFSKEIDLSSIEEVYELQLEENKSLISSLQLFLENKIDYIEYGDMVRKNITDLYMDDYFVSGQFTCFYEMPPIGLPSDGVPLPFYWMAAKYLEKTYGMEPRFVCLRYEKDLGICFEFEINNEYYLISTDPYFEYTEIKKKADCKTFTGTANKYDANKIDYNIQKWKKYSYDSDGFKYLVRGVLPLSSNYDRLPSFEYKGTCAWTASSNMLSWLCYVDYAMEMDDLLWPYWDPYGDWSYSEDWINYPPGDIRIFDDTMWGWQVQFALFANCAYTYHPENTQYIQNAWDGFLEDCGYDEQDETWDYSTYSAYEGTSNDFAYDELCWEIDGINYSLNPIPTWCGLPEDYTGSYPTAHAVAVVGYEIDDNELRWLLVNDGEFEHKEYPQIWWQDHPSYVPTYLNDFVHFFPIPQHLDIGIFCTLAYFLGTAGAHNVEVGFKIDGEPDLAFQGFYLYRANNKSDLGKIGAIAQFFLRSPAHPDGYTVQQFMDGIRYTDTPPTNEKFYYMLSEIGGHSWIFEVNTDGSADEDDYLTYCSDSDVEGGLNQPLPPDCPGTLPPFICTSQPGGPPRPDPPSNADAIDNPNDYGGAIKLTWTPAQGPYITNQKIFRSYANSNYYGVFQWLATLDKNANSYIDNTVENYHHYYYVIRSVVIDGEEEYQSYDSRMTIAVAQDNRPYPPYNLAVQDKPNDQGGAIIISFNPPYAGEAGIDYYQIFRKIPGSGNVAMIGTVDATGQRSYSFTDVNAPIGIDYEYWAKSVGFNQLFSYESNHGVCHSVDNIAPTPPTNLTGICAGLSVVLHWTLSRNDPFYTGPQGLTPRDVQEYHIYRWTNTGLQKNDLNSNDYPLAIVPAGTSGYTDSTVQPGTTYYYCVKSKDTSNLSVSSNVVTIHTPSNISLNDDLQFSDNDVSPSLSEKSNFSISPLSDLLKMNNSKSDVSGLDALSNDDSFGIFASEVSIYPNPASESANIKIPESVSLASIPCTVHIYDLTGRLVYEAVGDYADTICWNLCDNNGSMLTNGIYIINIENQYDQSTKPLLIMR